MEFKNDFRHEQNLLIHEEQDVLIMGCGHSGVISILESAKRRPSFCFGGFHVYNPVSKKTVSQNQLNELAIALGEYRDIKFYTCHCTGYKAYSYLNEKYDNIMYFSCGSQMTI